MVHRLQSFSVFQLHLGLELERALYGIIDVSTTKHLASTLQRLELAKKSVGVYPPPPPPLSLPFPTLRGSSAHGSRLINTIPYPGLESFISTASTLPRPNARLTTASRESACTADSSYELAIRPPAPG